MRRIIALLSLMIGLSSCGYSFQGSGSVLPADVRKIYIPLAENNTTEPGLATLVTDAMRDRFDRFGTVQVVEKIGEADAVLNMAILSVKRNTRSVTSSTDLTQQYDTTMTMRGTLQRISGTILWTNRSIQVTKSYGTSSSSVVKTSPGFANSGLNSSDLNALDSREISRGQEQQSLELLAEQAATQVYNESVAPDF